MPSSKKYSRLIINGFQEDRKKLFLLKKSLRTTLLSLFNLDSKTNEPLLRVPLSQVKEVYSPQGSLRAFLKNPPKLPDIQKVWEDVTYSVNFLGKNGIPFRALGFYGSLQCGIYPRNIAKDFNDIDFLISGLKYQNLIISLAKNHRHPIRYRRIDSKNALGIKIEKTQLDSTVVVLKRKGHLIDLHLTQVRDKNDPFSFPDISTLRLKSGAVEIAGQVIDSSEGLTCPSVYKVKTAKGMIPILNRYYRFTKAAIKGDRIIARGKISKEGKYLLITDPEKHFLTTAS